MPDSHGLLTARAATPERITVERQQWIPVYPRYPIGHLKEGQIISNSLPIDWICTCTKDGTALKGGKSCPACGRVPLDHSKLISKQFVKNTRDEAAYRKFGKR